MPITKSHRIADMFTMAPDLPSNRRHRGTPEPSCRVGRHVLPENILSSGRRVRMLSRVSGGARKRLAYCGSAVTLLENKLENSASYLTSESSLNIGRYIEMMITPTIAPTPIIISG